MSLRARLFDFWMKKRPKNVSAMKVIAITFACIILLGAMLLTLPAASRNGDSCAFGPKIGVDGSGLFLAPHIQYRLGLAF